MPIQNSEDANKYLDNIIKHLRELRILSLDAGLNSHASIWLAVESAFIQSSDEINTITDMMKMYIDTKLREMNL